MSRQSPSSGSSTGALFIGRVPDVAPSDSVGPIPTGTRSLTLFSPLHTGIGSKMGIISVSSGLFRSPRTPGCRLPFVSRPRSDYGKGPSLFAGGMVGQVNTGGGVSSIRVWVTVFRRRSSGPSASGPRNTLEAPVPTTAPSTAAGADGRRDRGARTPLRP